MTIAGGIMGALYHRERTGEATVVDVSLFGVGLWAMGQAVALSLQLGVGWAPPPADRLSSNPLSRNYDTKDGRVLAFTCLQAGRTGRRCARPSAARSWPPTSASPTTRPSRPTAPGGGRPDRGLRLGHAGGVAGAARRLLGQWAVVQDTLEAAADPQAVANGYVQECRTAAGTPFQLVAVPVQYDEEPAAPQRAPEFNEHGDAVLAELGLSDEEIVGLKVRGVVA